MGAGGQDNGTGMHLQASVGDLYGAVPDPISDPDPGPNDDPTRAAAVTGS